MLERLFVFLALAVILLISSFNIFTALSMLAVEKRRDLAVLGAMGAKPSLIWQTFLALGLAISILGAVMGVWLGLALCWLQDTFKLVSMGMESAIVQEYPVEVHGQDLWLIALTVVLVAVGVSWLPAKGAVKASVR
jgi:lipoprotein-releasing system permease protein